jgi:3'-phosphoadenosine 5'-phosphosulfate sulfotransferase (PAPS reductase)/FAD synthetase
MRHVLTNILEASISLFFLVSFALLSILLFPRRIVTFLYQDIPILQTKWKLFKSIQKDQTVHASLSHKERSDFAFWLVQTQYKFFLPPSVKQDMRDLCSKLYKLP